jgi:hypothetical protein
MVRIGLKTRPTFEASFEPSGSLVMCRFLLLYNVARHSRYRSPIPLELAQTGYMIDAHRVSTGRTSSGYKV